MSEKTIPIRVNISEDLIKRGLKKLGKEHTLENLNGLAKNKSLKAVLLEVALREFLKEKR